MWNVKYKNKMITPIELLTKELVSLQKDLSKSTKIFQSGGISAELHEQHKRNIQPNIDIYQEAINILTAAKYSVTTLVPLHLTLEKLREYHPGKVFATGVLPNSKEGLFMNNQGGLIRWIAKKGCDLNDWAIYCHWKDKTVDWIKEYGDKVQDEKNIKRCVTCTDEVFQLYRH